MAKGEVLIGCVVAMGLGPELRVVARGCNRVYALGRKTAHAEYVTLVSTMEPRVMCLGAAMEAGVTRVLFGLEAPADNGTQRVRPPKSPESSAPDVTGGILPAESRALFEWLEGKEQAKFVEQFLALTE